MIVGMGAGDAMWTEAHRARHEPGLKELVAACTVEEVAAWLERADPPRSGRATPTRRVVGAVAWHSRVGGPWRALPAGWPPWRTVYGWFRRWLELGLFDALLREVARRRRRKAGRRPGPTRGIVGAQVVKCVAVRGPRGHDAGKPAGKARQGPPTRKCHAIAPTTRRAGVARPLRGGSARPRHAALSSTAHAATSSFRPGSCRARCASVHI